MHDPRLSRKRRRLRGTSTATRWLHDVFHRRGHDTYATVTGDRPISLYNGEQHAIDRSEQVSLYENERELARFDEVDVAVVENQGTRPYTTRLVNETYVDPHVVLLTNVREDHRETLGGSRVQIARSLARAVSPDTVVVNGETDPDLRSYLTPELERRDADVRRVDPPESASWIPGAEVVYGVDEVLDVLDRPRLQPSDSDRKFQTMIPSWRLLRSGRTTGRRPHRTSCSPPPSKRDTR